MYETIKNQVKELSKEVMEKIFGGLKTSASNVPQSTTNTGPQWVPGTDPDTWFNRK
jgi:hypothetical protein